MKFRVVLLGVLICLVAQAAGKPSQGVPTMNQSDSKTQQSLTGCIDEQDGQYVLLDDQMRKITSLQSAGSDKDVFAKYVGSMVQVRGTKSSERNATFKVTSIKEVAGNCGQAK
ncbi:MAG: hypothetical protein WBL61_06720 [Bryobacteraceae bacterium]